MEWIIIVLYAVYCFGTIIWICKDRKKPMTKKEKVLAAILVALGYILCNAIWQIV